MKTIIVTRHPGALAWIQKHHPEIGGKCPSCEGSGFHEEEQETCHCAGGYKEVQTIAQATPEDLIGNRIIGILPVDLAALCGEYWALNMKVPAEYRGKELTCEDMERFGCSIKRFLVFPEERIAEVEHALAAELSRWVAETA